MAQKLLMGNKAFAHAALEAGISVAAGYPGTPSSEVIETIAALHTRGNAHGVYVEWSTNEKAALELLAGASLCGARTLFTCKQVGLNVASDPLMSLNYIGIRGGFVLFVADDPGPISSQTEQDTRRFAAFAKIPVLDPSTPEEGFAMMKAAFDLSERYQTPVIVRSVTRVSHSSAFIDVADQTQAGLLPKSSFERNSRWVIFPKRAFMAHGEVNRRLPQIAHEFASCPDFSVFNMCVGSGSQIRETDTAAATDAEKRTADTQGYETKAMAGCMLEGKASAGIRLGIVAGGISSAYTREALRMMETRSHSIGCSLPAYRLWQVGTPYPFPAEIAADFTRGLTDILVIEELDSVLEEALLAFAGQTHASYTVHGKLTGEARDRGENDVDDIVLRLSAFFETSGGVKVPEVLTDIKGPEQTDSLQTTTGGFTYSDQLPLRPPVLCAGCPHRGSFYAVKKACEKTSAVLCGDIGCYTLGNAQPLDAIDTCLCMGAGITMAQGFAVAQPDKKHVGFVGDSTFFASGITGLVNAVYNGHNIMVAVLDNATTAMTGRQPHPGTGITLMGDSNPALSIQKVLEAIGFTCIEQANPLDVTESIAAAKRALSHDGPSAVIFSSPCIQLHSPDAPVSIDKDRCTGCRRCITEIGCPGIAFDMTRVGAKSDLRGQAFIDGTLCNGCGLCMQICPSAAIEVGVA